MKKKGVAVLIVVVDQRFDEIDQGGVEHAPRQKRVQRGANKNVSLKHLRK